jgi:hypothetical protein
MIILGVAPGVVNELRVLGCRTSQQAFSRRFRRVGTTDQIAFVRFGV